MKFNLIEKFDLFVSFVLSKLLGHLKWLSDFGTDMEKRSAAVSILFVVLMFLLFAGFVASIGILTLGVVIYFVIIQSAKNAQE